MHKLIYFLFKSYLLKINDLYNRHNGEECYVIADGISLKSMDLGKFSDKVSIVCNYVPFHKDFDKLDCKYIVNCVPFFFSPIGGKYDRQLRKYMSNMAFLYRELFDLHPKKIFFSHITSLPFIRRKNIVYMFQKIIDQRLDSNFIGNNVDCMAGAFRTSIMLAIYMGFKKIYLVGCDYTHEKPMGGHWYEKGFGQELNFNPVELELNFLKMVKKSIEITTITLDCGSLLLDSINYEHYTKSKPKYMENYELTHQKNLESLSTYSKFLIF